MSEFLDGYGDLLLPSVALVGWFVLFRWVLPLMGVPTCMSGSCAPGPRGPSRDVVDPEDTIDYVEEDGD